MSENKEQETEVKTMDNRPGYARMSMRELQHVVEVSRRVRMGCGRTEVMSAEEHEAWLEDCQQLFDHDIPRMLGKAEAEVQA